ncbi:MAG: hypothetical protein Kow0029_03550 [Candidatus Rifleibacteriota bacterium]
MPSKPVQTELSGSVAKLVTQIRRYFSGEKYSFRNASIEPENSSDFSRKVFEALCTVPHGSTVSYSDLAKMAGKPGAARAIGRIVGTNPIPLLIPCHRVVCSDGKLGGFSSEEGIYQKALMLELEGNEIQKDARSARLVKPKVLNRELSKSGTRYLMYKDKELAKWIDRLPECRLSPDNVLSPFQALLEAIIYQQLTGKAAATIYSRVLSLFGSNGFVSPFDIIRSRESELRKAGLSGAKILAIKDLAEKSLEGYLPGLAQLERISNEGIINLLTQIRGIGRWTAEMFLIFKLGRADVLAADDYGLKKGLAILTRMKKLPTSSELKAHAEKWKPYRSIASWYLWRIAETKLPAN